MAAGVAFVLIACGAVKQRGELMLAMQTDLELPKDVDTVRIEVTSFGKTLFAQDYPVGPDGVKIPATLGVVGDPSSPSTPIEVRVIASQAGTLRVLRNVTTTVPPDRTAVLRMPLAWLCWNQVTTDSTNTAQSSCPTGQTCIAGECASNAVDSTQLKEFDPAQIFGGSADASGGACLDTIACFAEGVLAAVDTSDCSVPKPANAGAGINVAMIRKPGVPGICSPEACYVPLDEDPTEGWIDGGDKILLPPAVCNRLTAPATPNLSILGVVVTTSCATKTSATPTCGPWSSVGGSEGTFEAGVPAGFDAGPNTDFVGTWTADGLTGAESCDGETFSTTLNISQDAQGNYSIDESVGPVTTVDGTCQALTQDAIPATLNADGTLTFTPSIAQLCSCDSSALTVTLSISPDGVLDASEAFSDIDQCPSMPSTGGPDAGTVADATLAADDSGSGSGKTGQGTEEDGGSSGAIGNGFCSTCGGISCTVAVSFVRQSTGTGSGLDGGSTPDASVQTDASASRDSGTIQAPCETTCSGCCDQNEICQQGMSDSQCGENGSSCQDCTTFDAVCNAISQCVAGPDDSGAPVDASSGHDSGAKLPDGG